MAAGIQAKQSKILKGLSKPTRGPKTGAKAEEERFYAELQNVINNRTWNPDDWVVTDDEILKAAIKAVPTIAASVRRKKDKIAKKMQPALDDTYDVRDDVNSRLGYPLTRDERISKSSEYQRLRGEKADTRKGIAVPGA